MSSDKSTSFTWVYAGDGLNLSAVSLLVLWILHKRTCKGISGRTQIIASLVDFLQFAYAAAANKDFYEEAPEHYSLIVSGVTLTVSSVLMYVMYGKYKKTIEKDFDTFWIEVLIILCGGFALVANPVYMDAKDKSETDPLAVLFYMSMYLSAVSILPQIYFNYRTGSKTLCVSLYVLLSTLSTFFYMYYLVTANIDSNEIDFDRLEATPKYTVYPECGQLLSYALFFILLIVVPKYEEVLPVTLSEISSTAGSSVDGDGAEDSEKNYPPNYPGVIIVKRPQLDRQQSLLETPFLKKSLHSSASLVSSNPDKLSTLRGKTVCQQPKPNIARMMRLTHLKRAQTSTSELFTLGAASAPSTPEDEGFLMFKETAVQSRRRRQEYIRRRSLPITSTESAMETSPTADFGKVKFQIGDEEDVDDFKNELQRRKHRKTLSFEKFLAAQKLKSKQAEIDCEENNKNVFNPPTVVDPRPKDLGDTSDQLDKSIGAVEIKIENPVPKIKAESAPRRPKVSDASVKKLRRLTSYQLGSQSPQMQNNWKTLATNFLGTGPIEVRRPPSVQDISATELARIDKRRRNRIFSVA